MVNIRVVAVLLFSIVSISMAFAQGPVFHPVSTSIGLTPGEAWERHGPPESISSFRGQTPLMDNVVFTYSDGLSLFWFQNRIWQLRLDPRWTGDLDGLSFGMNRSEVDTVWGAAINPNASAPTWELPHRGYPVRVRLYFEEDSLVDLYIYRSDW